MLTLFAFALAQDYVTVPATIGSAPKVVEALSKASGAKLSVSPVFKNEIIGLACPGKSLTASMDALALAVEGVWTTRDGGYVLERPLALENKRKARDLDARRASLKIAIATATSKIETSELDLEKARALQERFKKATAGTEPDHTALHAVSLKAPSSQLVQKLLACVNPDDLLDIPSSGRTVFSMNPNRMQRGFAKDVRPILESFAAQQNVWAEVFAGSDSSLLSSYQIASNPISDVSRVLLIASYYQGINAGSYRLIAKVFDKDGALVLEGHASLPAVYLRFLMHDTFKEAAAQRDPVMIPPSADEKKFFAHVAKRRTSRLTTPIFPTDMETLLRRPDVIDPLAMAATNALETLAVDKRKIVAAVLPDSLLYPYFRQVSARTISVLRWLEELRPQRMELIENDSAITLRPEMPLLNDAVRTKRPVFAKLLAATDRNGDVRLAPTAEFFYHHANNGSYGPSYHQAIGGQLRFADRNLLGLFHTLTEAQKQRLRKGEKLGMQEFTTEQRGFLHAMLYHTDPRMFRFQRGAKPGAGRMGETILSETTEIFPEGLPTNTIVSVGYVEEVAVFGMPETAHTFMGRMDAESIAAERLRRLRPELRAAEEKQHDPTVGRWSSKLVEGVARTWNFEIAPAPDTVMRYSLTDDSIGEKTYALDKLPDPLQKQVDELLEQYKKRFEKGMPTERGPAKVPPPL